MDGSKEVDEDLFPYSNKHETKKKTIAEESKQWESLFDPQYTFGSFQHGIAKPVTDLYYRGKWPLDHEDMIGMIPKSEPATTLFPNVPSPTLPNIKDIQLHINTEHHDDSQIEILPRPFPKYKKNAEVLCKDRLALLNIIQEMGFNKENDATQRNPYKQFSTAARLQRQIKNKTEQMKREIMVDPEDEEEINDNVSHHSVAMEPDTLDQSSLASMDDMYEKISFHTPKQDEKEQEIKRKNRASFLYFAFGFLFPPLWIIGALYVPTSQRTSASKAIDKKWKMYSRNALFAFMVAIVLTIVLVLMLKPESVGFRNSNEEGYQEARVVFDEDVILDPNASI